MRLRLSEFGIVFVLMALIALPVWGDPSASKRPALTPPEASALEFAKTHHPELASLLEQLRDNAPKDFQAAVTDLNRIRERLDRSRKNTPERYELELAEWKLTSRIRLLAARLSMGGDTSLEDELRDALAERVDLRLKLLQEERDRTQKRLVRLDEQIADQERRAEEIVDREFAALRNAKKPAGRETTTPRKKAPPKTEAAKPAPPKSDAAKSSAKPASSKPPKKSNDNK